MPDTHYLTLNSNTPFVTCDTLQDELLLYNLSPTAYERMLNDFFKITTKKLDKQYPINTLSGGQKVILMVLLALYSPAPRLRFINVMQAIDVSRRNTVALLISQSDKDIILEDSQC